METVIKKQVKGKTMEAIFENSEVISVRHYNALNLLDADDYDENETYIYEIVIRHPEDTDAGKLFTKEVKKFEGIKKQYKIQVKQSFETSFSDEKFMTGGAMIIGFKEAVKLKNSLQKMCSSLKYKVTPI